MPFDPNNHSHAAEIYEVVKVIEVEVSLAGNDPKGIPTRLRLEALRDMRGGGFSVRGYIEGQVIQKMQPTFSEDIPYKNVAMWLRYVLPYAEGDDADEILEKAIWALRTECV